MLALVRVLTDWREKAACRGLAQRVFFGMGPRTKARVVCSGCPVRLDCLEEALTQETMDLDTRYGIRGGLNPHERQTLMVETMALYRS